MHTQSLATNLPALGANLVPGATVHLVGSVAELTGEGDDLGDDEFGHTAGVGERGVEDGDTMAGSKVEVDLVGANAEATNDKEVLGLTQNTLGKLGLRADADDVDIAGDGLLASVTEQFLISIDEGRE